MSNKRTFKNSVPYLNIHDSPFTGLYSSSYMYSPVPLWYANYISFVWYLGKNTLNKATKDMPTNNNALM